MADLSDKIAIVTGGAQGIGRAIAERLAHAGASVVVGDLQEAADPTGIGFARLDVTDEASVASFLSKVVAEHGGIDIVVNNAGIMFEKTIDEQTSADWDLMMAVNLRGPFLVSKHAAPHLRARGGGAIVNVGSIEGFACNPNHTAYAASKAGVHGLTNALAIDLGPDGIRVNAVAPGWIDTDLNASYVDSHPNRDEVIDQLAQLHPVGHIGNPDDVGDVVVWLAGSESRFVTGQVITVDGGRTGRPTLPPIFGL